MIQDHVASPGWLDLQGFQELVSKDHLVRLVLQDQQDHQVRVQLVSETIGIRTVSMNS